MIKHALLDLYRSHSNRFMSGALALYLVMLIFASNTFLERTLIGMFNDKLAIAVTEDLSGLTDAELDAIEAIRNRLAVNGGGAGRKATT